MAQSFKHPTCEQGCQIRILKERGYSAVEIAKARRNKIFEEIRSLIEEELKLN